MTVQVLETRLLVDRLLRGVATNDTRLTRDSRRALVSAGSSGVPVILAKLDSPAWAQRPMGPSTKYLGALLELLLELDASAFQREIVRLRGSKLHDGHRNVVNFLARMGGSEPVTYLHDDTSVHISNFLSDPEIIAASVKRWSRGRGINTAEVSRIDVIPRSQASDYLGRYLILQSAIILTWPDMHTHRLLRLWYRYRAELTFYHEVGHHVCGHLEGGQVKEQEDEANRFARRAFRRAHPVLVFCGRVILLPFLPILLIALGMLRRRKANQLQDRAK